MLKTEFIKSNKFIPYPTGLFTDTEIRDYQNAFSQYYNNDNFVVKFIFVRYIGSSKRYLEWIALNTEGMATLISLTNLTNEHPKILCTIQSGILEHPNSLFTRLIYHLKLRSKIWIRGFWTRDEYLFLNNNNPISNFPPYQYTVQDYGFWYSNMGQNGFSFEENDTVSKLSRVRAFTNESNFQVPNTTTITGNNNSKILLINGDIRSADLSQYDLVVTSERILSNFDYNNLKYWNMLFTIRSYYDFCRKP
jgi:hypothetical protein